MNISIIDAVGGLEVWWQRKKTVDLFQAFMSNRLIMIVVGYSSFAP